MYCSFFKAANPYRFLFQTFHIEEYLYVLHADRHIYRSDMTAHCKYPPYMYKLNAISHSTKIVNENPVALFCDFMLLEQYRVWVFR